VSNLEAQSQCAIMLPEIFIHRSRSAEKHEIFGVLHEKKHEIFGM
jgi:hypothetical protein